jgi:error-prone DNA polymerase
MHPCDRKVAVAGLVLNRQRPGTAHGITFMTLEDETGVANLIIHEGTWRRFRAAATESTALIVRGRLERKDQVIHLIVEKLEDLGKELASLSHRSRDFR